MNIFDIPQLAPANIGGGAWLAQGPGPATDGQVEGITGGNVVGAIHTVVAHPTDANILYVGGTNGGIWKTTNGASADPFWSPLVDGQASLSIGALAHDPTDATHGTLLAGIGRYSSFGGHGGARTGLLHTTDGGTNWTPIDGSGTLAGANISGVAPRGTTLVVSVNVADLFSCSNIGIFQSTNGGTSFTQRLAGVTHDLASDPAANGTLYTSLIFGPLCSGPPNGIYKSTNTGQDWTKVSDAAMDVLLVDNVPNNVEIAVGTGDHVYVNIVRGGQTAGLFHSANGGTSWTAMDLPLVPDGSALNVTNATFANPIVITTSSSHFFSTGRRVNIAGVTGNTAANGAFSVTVTSATAFSLDGSVGNGVYAGGGTATPLVSLNPRVKPGSQGSIHASIRVDPNVPTTVYLGGDRQDTPFPNFIGAVNFSGNLMRGDTTVTATGAAPSPQWEHLTHSNLIVEIPGGGTASTSSPHADSREMVFDANGTLIETDDGGIYRRTSPADNTGDWFSINSNLQMTEMHNVAYDSVANVIMSGNQDTGTTQQPTPGALTWESVHTADGGDVAVDDTSVIGFSTRFSSFQNLGAFRRRVYDTSNVFQSQVFPSLTVLAGGDSLVPKFVTPVQLNARDASRLVIGGCNSVYESLDQGDSITQIGGLSGGCIMGSIQNAIAYGGRMGGVDNLDVLYVGATTDVYVRTTGGAGLSLSATYPGGSTVNDIALDPDNWMTAFVVESTTVYQTTNAGTSWTVITGNLTDTGLQSAVVMNGNLLVGGRDGIFQLPLPAMGPFTWGELGTGLPNVPVWDMEYDAVDNVLVAGTLGRGAWTLQPAGACGFAADLILRNRIISGTETIKACNTITGGPDLTTTGTVLIAAGVRVVLNSGVTLGGTVTIDIDGTLAS